MSLLPGSLDEVTVAWLTDVLSADRALDGRVTDSRRAPLAGGIPVTSSVGRFLLLVVEEESLRDASTVQSHWERLGPLLCLYS